MRSRAIRRLILLFSVAVIGLAGCGLKTGEEPFRQAPIELDSNNMNCLMEVDSKVTAYFAGRMTRAEVMKFFDCAKASLVSFKAFVRGARETSYTPEEIRNFLTFYFVRDRKISDDLLSEAMAIKVAVVGGAADRVTRAEFDRLIDLVEFAKEQLLLLQPHVEVLNVETGRKLRDRGRLSPERFLAARRALDRLALEFGRKWSVNVGTYSLESLKRFVAELNEFLGWKTPHDRFRFYRWMDLVKLSKQFNVGGDVDDIEPSQWVPFLQGSVVYYSAFLNYEYFVDWTRWHRPEVFSRLAWMVRQLLDQIEKSAVFHVNQTLSFRLFERATKVFENLDLIPMDVAASSLSHTFSRVMERLYGDTQRDPLASPLKGLTMPVLQRLRGDLEDWMETQTYLSSFADRGIEDLTEVLARSLPGESRLAERHRESLLRLLSLPNLFLGESQRVVLAHPSDAGGAVERRTYQGLSRQNIARGLIEAFLRGYSRDAERIAGYSGFKIDEIELLYFDFKPTGIDLTIMDPRNARKEEQVEGSLTVGRRAFLEGNIFTYESDGFPSGEGIENGLLSVPEAFGLLTTIYSGGRTSQKIFAELKVKCLSQEMLACAESHSRRRQRGRCAEWGQLDLYGLPKIPRACYDREIAHAHIRAIDNMPRRQKILRHEKDTEKLRRYFYQLWEAGHKKEEDTNFVELAELQFSTTISLYQEVIMTRFDANGDDVLTENEIWEAYPIFAEAIKFMGRKKMGLSNPVSGSLWWGYAMNDEEARRAYALMLEKLAFPGAEDLGQILWWKDLASWKISMTRFELNQILTKVIRQLAGE